MEEAWIARPLICLFPLVTCKLLFLLVSDKMSKWYFSFICVKNFFILPWTFALCHLTLRCGSHDLRLGTVMWHTLARGVLGGKTNRGWRWAWPLGPAPVHPSITMRRTSRAENQSQDEAAGHVEQSPVTLVTSGSVDSSEVQSDESSQDQWNHLTDLQLTPEVGTYTLTGVYAWVFIVGC